VTLTPEELERAARYLCKTRGTDPDAPHFGGDNGFNPRSEWRVAADEIERWLHIGTAVFFVKEDPCHPPSTES
jgi:hypothetical protein